MPFEVMESHAKRFLLERGPWAMKLLQRALGATHVSTFVFHTNMRPAHVQSLLQAMPAAQTARTFFQFARPVMVLNQSPVQKVRFKFARLGRHSFFFAEPGEALSRNLMRQCKFQVNHILMFLDKLFVFYLGNKDKKTEPSSSTAAAVVTIAARPWA
jgi:hypothetical protein